MITSGLAAPCICKEKHTDKTKHKTQVVKLASNKEKKKSKTYVSVGKHAGWKKIPIILSLMVTRTQFKKLQARRTKRRAQRDA
jgi:ethanolamine utilization protein EutP (predicted NTPase)